MNKLPFDFLNLLKSNNNREWFAENKGLYEDAKQSVERFTTEIIKGISLFDKNIIGLEVKDTIFRIYRDVRFSKDKQPYKTAFGSYIAKGGRKSNNAGYYLHIEPNASFLAGGMWCPESNQLAKVRQEIMYNVENYKSIIESKEFINTFHSVQGDKLKNPPKGFPADFLDIELLKFKDFIVKHELSNEFVLAENSINHIVDIFHKMKPFNDFLNSSLD